jgi:hypothetical protein
MSQISLGKSGCGIPFLGLTADEYTVDSTLLQRADEAILTARTNLLAYLPL